MYSTPFLYIYRLIMVDTFSCHLVASSRLAYAARSMRLCRCAHGPLACSSPAAWAPPTAGFRECSDSLRHGAQVHGDAIDGPGIRSLLNLRWQRSIPVAFSVAYLRQAQGVKGLSAVKTEVALFHGICQQWLCYSLYSPP